MNYQFLGQLTFKELAARIWRETNEDNILGRAAELAYYFLLALFPMLIFLTSLVGFLPGLREAIFTGLAEFVPGEAMRLVSETISDVTRRRSGGLISFGILGALWAASGGVTAVMGTLNTAYDVREERSFWKVRLIAIGLTVLLALMVVSGTALIMFGDRFAVWLAAQLGMGTTFTSSLPDGAGAVVFRLGVDLLLRAERRAGLEVDHAGRGFRRHQPGLRLAALFALSEICA
jgi:membrane protein